MSPLILREVSFERPLKIFFIGVCIIFFLSYAALQARNLILGPTIALSESVETIQDERFVTVHGEARNVIVLWLNGQEIHTNERGVFEHTLTLENGYTIMTLEAEDRFGRRT